MNYRERIYQFNEYVLGYDKGENDRSCLVIGKYLLDKLYVMAELYDGSAEIISTILDSLQQENKQLKDNWDKLKEIVKSQSGFKKRADLKGGLWFEIDELLDEMQELEQGSD